MRSPIRQLKLTTVCVLAGLLVAQHGARADEAADTKPTPTAIPWTEALDHIGEEVTVEGQVATTYASKLSTLLSFDESFNRFTAVIRPAELGAFPDKPEEYYRGKRVRITGKLIEYDKKAEIVLRSPAQIQLLEPEPPPPPEDDHDAMAEITLELLQRLTTIESNLEALADRLDLILAAIERQGEAESPAVYLLPGRLPETEAPPRPAYEALRRIKQGMTSTQVEDLMGPPVYVDPNTEGGEIWYYGGGRMVTFGRRGRVQAMAGFNLR
jgi:hypothetical protein